MASPFSSHMVLQREREIPVWGSSLPNSLVTVVLAGQETATTADSEGQWSVSLPAQSAGGSYTLFVGSGGKNIALQNVTMGDVWVCSGQSNMQWSVSRSAQARSEVAAADFPDIRLLSIPRKASAKPVDSFHASWAVCSPETIPDFSAVAYFFGRKIFQTTGIPIGLISSNWGGTPAEAWTPLTALMDQPEFTPLLQKRENFLSAPVKPLNEMTPAEKKRHRPQRISAMLFHGMIQPLVHIPIRGVIWYQGEANASRAHQYRTLFPAMIRSWRQAWGQGDFPFYFVQLANYRQRQDQPGDDTWAELRNAQFETLQVPNSGMAVSIDIGDANDIHPQNKQEVGKRLALWALAKDYGITQPKPPLGSVPFIGTWFQQPLTHSGPLFQAYQVVGDQIRIQFEHTVTGLHTSDGKPLRGFSIAGPDRQFIWADAVIEGREVVVSHPDISAPASVRYGWASNPAVNLINSSGLPASPFRTDDWPGITVNQP
ncbi:MAG: sialate O-acetylesterase [Verrucomicrobiota bacterium]